MSNTANPKREVFENLARIGTALSSPIRLELLELLAQGERTVEQLAALTETSIANTSQHLQKLKQVGLIVGRKEGQYVYYRSAGDEVVALLGALGRVGETYLAEVERTVRMSYTAKDELEPSCSSARARAWSRCSTCGRRRNLLRGTCRAPLTFRSTSSSDAWPSCPGARRSSPIAAGPSA